MLVKYVFADGEISEVEVSEEVGQFIVESRKAEHANNEKEKYHCQSSDTAIYEGEDYADDKTVESILDDEEFVEAFNKVYSTLTEVQKRRIEMYEEGMSYREIGRKEGVDHKKVMKSMELVRKKFENFQK